MPSTKEETPKVHVVKRSHYKTGYYGVYKKGWKFVAHSKFNGEKKFIGYFTKAIDAALAYDVAYVELSVGNGRTMVPIVK